MPSRMSYYSSGLIREGHVRPRAGDQVLMLRSFMVTTPHRLLALSCIDQIARPGGGRTRPGGAARLVSGPGSTAKKHRSSTGQFAGAEFLVCEGSATSHPGWESMPSYLSDVETDRLRIQRFDQCQANAWST